jgi:hypothetical protein
MKKHQRREDMISKLDNSLNKVTKDALGYRRIYPFEIIDLMEKDIGASEESILDEGKKLAHILCHFASVFTPMGDYLRPTDTAGAHIAEGCLGVSPGDLFSRIASFKIKVEKIVPIMSDILQQLSNFKLDQSSPLSEFKNLPQLLMKIIQVIPKNYEDVAAAMQIITNAISKNFQFMNVILENLNIGLEGIVKLATQLDKTDGKALSLDFFYKALKFIDEESEKLLWIKNNNKKHIQGKKVKDIKNYIKGFPKNKVLDDTGGSSLGLPKLVKEVINQDAFKAEQNKVCNDPQTCNFLKSEYVINSENHDRDDFKTGQNQVSNQLQHADSGEGLGGIDVGFTGE